MLVELSAVEQRYRAVLEVLDEGTPVTEVARRYGVARQTVHEWLARHANVVMRRVGEPGEWCSLHNGLFGPATQVFVAVQAACREGAAQGEWSAGHATVRMRGRDLRRMLDGLPSLAEEHYPRPEDKARLTAFRATIDGDAEYEVNAIEG